MVPDLRYATSPWPEEVHFGAAAGRAELPRDGVTPIIVVTPKGTAVKVTVAEAGSLGVVVLDAVNVTLPPAMAMAKLAPAPPPPPCTRTQGCLWASSRCGTDAQGTSAQMPHAGSGRLPG